MTNFAPESIGSYVDLQTRISVAKSAFKTWFRICPGHNEFRQRWLALFYRRIPPTCRLHDSVLGRHVAEFIREELRELGLQQLIDDASRSISHHANAECGTALVVNARKDSYVHVRLAQPDDDPLVFVRPLGAVLTSDFPATVPSRAKFVSELRSLCGGDDLRWSESQLDDDVKWFRANKQDVIAKIPSLSLKPKKRARTALVDRSVQTVGARSDVFQVDTMLYIRVDLPGVAPDEDFCVQASGNRLRVRGRRNCRVPVGAVVQQIQCTYGLVDLILELPDSADATRVEHVELRNGVLSAQLCTDVAAWRVIPVAIRNTTAAASQAPAVRGTRDGPRRVAEGTRAEDGQSRWQSLIESSTASTVATQTPAVVSMSTPFHMIWRWYSAQLSDIE
eukprot:TRINITY_DN2370_c0_g1_i2.p1 TRINITY_DN2370_c0_g1~~TRINITY_DN2370_c0_g1_i2.p1  ORF type:complete len:408 (+),score=-0.57 TRINITY_DN2370_c0_g1_i2:47-1225(+)